MEIILYSADCWFCGISFKIGFDLSFFLDKSSQQ